MRGLGYWSYDEMVQEAAELLRGRSLRWRKVPEPEGKEVPEGISWYYAENRLYVVRDARGAVERFAFVVAGRAEEAVRVYLRGERPTEGPRPDWDGEGKRRTGPARQNGEGWVAGPGGASVEVEPEEPYWPMGLAEMRREAADGTAAAKPAGMEREVKG
ncbi:MAG: hypothetical protein IK066_00695 [Kiritimatiellae bacterium]|nr:hypothetical protein [Kiritimatiellia bacterium]